MHKIDEVRVSELGGLIVACGFIAGVLVYVGINIFILKDTSSIYLIFAVLISILFALLIGIVDDILGWKVGIRQIHKVLLTFVISFPIVAINAGTAIMAFPIIGHINLGLIYPLIIVPIIIVGFSNAANMIAGYNGLEASMGIIIISALSYLCFLQEVYWIAVMGACMVVSLLAFLLYNFYPAKIFGGDTLTYVIGAMAGIMAIMGNIEKYALILILPYFFEFVLKARGKMKKESFSKVMPDGTLQNAYEKWYGLEHIVVWLLIRLKQKAREYEVVMVFILIEAGIAAVTIRYYFC